MSVEPPPFQESARCDVCKCSFNTFRRRHHCRCCGRTLCHEHSSNQMALPQFGLHTLVRVCSDCFNDSSRLGKVDPVASLDGVNSVMDSVGALDINSNVDINSNLDLKSDEPAAVHHPVVGISDCRCGMPLCICEAPAAPMETVPLQRKTIATSTAHLNPKPKKTDPNLKHRGSTSNSKHGLVSSLGQVSNSSLDKPQMDYDANGEGLREAIKNGDAAAVKKLLSQGVDANYCDKQGLSVLHLAALFNQTDIAFILMESGASVEHKNAQGETPLDCAPATLQYKMQKKMDEDEQKV